MFNSYIILFFLNNLKKHKCTFDTLKYLYKVNPYEIQ